MTPNPAIVDYPVTQEWRDRMVEAMAHARMSECDLARAAGTSQAAIRYVFAKAKTSSLVPHIERALTGTAEPRLAPSDADEITAEVAALRESRDAVTDDILRLEQVQATVLERLAEAYEHRARIDVRIREHRSKRGL